ncbi:hypothetical protein [Pseudomonas sp. AN-1]|uniref:hypothetical protein n=1 Tax=Pseudomonas sp. AN-1 TaxID=3096605 RepID=UPI002A69DCFE|nr:hypothetical protein [Pseudomonas sp. AN-1]WPP46620.1 hypothetical protein SK095_04305 [Pseudomonas sp. AN-1]
MTMNPAEAIQRLTLIGLKPTTTMRDSLTIARRVTRHCCAIREEIRTIRHAARRKARKLRQFEPFTKQQVADLEQLARDYGAGQMASARTILAAYGEELMSDCHGYMAALGFDAVCDLLNVNTVEREQARAEGVADLAGLVFVHNLEDSAGHRDEDLKRGPLFDACMAAMSEFIKRTPRHLLPDPFARGGPLYGVPVHELHPDGSMTTKRPALVVHDASGSRTVER